MIEADLKVTLERLLHRPIYVAFVPSDSNDTVTVRRTGGNDLRCYHRTLHTGRVSRPVVQIFVQSPDYPSGLKLCERIVDLLDGITYPGFTAFLSGGIIPAGMGKNLGGELHMFSLNFNCVEDYGGVDAE